jgi:putative endonuclease
MCTVYAIKSISHNIIYVGMTNDLERRIRDHNHSLNRSTKAYAPFELIYKKEFPTRIEARVHEKYLKAGSGKEFLKSLLK